MNFYEGKLILLLKLGRRIKQNLRVLDCPGKFGNGLFLWWVYGAYFLNFTMSGSIRTTDNGRELLIYYSDTIEVYDWSSKFCTTR